MRRDGKGGEGWEGLGGPWRDGKGLEVLPKGWEESGVSPRVPEGVRRPSWRDGRGREVLWEDQEGSVGPPGGLGGLRGTGGLGDFSGGPGESGGLREGLGEVGRPFWRAGRDQEWRERIGGPARRPGGVGRPSQISRRGREDILEGQ